ncbi:GNAT family N-acetyltransferase [Butyrivibrio sp. WCD2001]|uniref:GNAT family N-acetyltransferase n=1 Tax=Butyrivibrio sp. WCD2001 TaxID=1280681 RepID=UPI00041100CE|nr:GNAT family N-acetyltransferase [Butyrivibrio sp. WCD2001]
MIRKAELRDLSRIAEILVFTKRIKYRSIFHNDDYSFNELQVVRVADEFRAPELLDKVWVYDDGIVKGMIHLEGKEIVELYVDYFFWGQGIGSKLLEFAEEKFDVKFVWTLEKNVDAVRFYETHGFKLNGKRQPEEGTPEYIVMLER